jgi:hypothetical protein
MMIECLRKHEAPIESIQFWIWKKIKKLKEDFANIQKEKNWKNYLTIVRLNIEKDLKAGSRLSSKSDRE